MLEATRTVKSHYNEEEDYPFRASSSLYSLSLCCRSRYICCHFSIHISMFLNTSISFFDFFPILIFESEICLLGQKLQANAEDNSDELVDPPKVEDKIGAVPQGLSTDSDVAKRYIYLYLCMCISSLFVRSLFLCIDLWFWCLNLLNEEKRSRSRRDRYEATRRSLSFKPKFRGLWIFSSIRFTVTKISSLGSLFQMLLM